MGRTLPSATQLMLQEEAALSRFRRALRRGDQLIAERDRLLEEERRQESFVAPGHFYSPIPCKEEIDRC